MADDDNVRLLVALEAKLNSFEKAFDKASGIADKGFSKVEKRVKDAGDRMSESMGGAVEKMNRALELVGVGVGLNEIKNMIEQYSALKARLEAATGSIEKAAAAQKALGDAAKQARVDNDGLAEAYLNNKQTLDALGYSSKTQIDYQQALAEALKLSGATADKASAIQDQLTKALANGSLEGKGLNAIFTDGAVVAKTLADALGVPVTRLKLLADQGRITSNVVVEALSGSLENLNKQLANKPTTFAESIVAIKNAMQDYVGELDEALQIQGSFGNAAKYIADHFHEIGDGALAAAAIMASQYVPGLARIAASQIAVLATNPFGIIALGAAAAITAIEATGDQITLTNGKMVSLGDAGAGAWEVVKQRASEAASAIEEDFSQAADIIAAALGKPKVSMAEVEQFAIAFGASIVEEFGLIYDNIVAAWENLPSALAELFVNAFNGIVSIIESAINTIIAGLDTVIEYVNAAGKHIGLTMSTIGAVDLGRVENGFGGAGKAAGKAFSDNWAKYIERVRKDIEAVNAAAEKHQGAREQKEGQPTTALDSADHPIQAVNAANLKSWQEANQKVRDNIATMRAEMAARAEATGSIEQQDAAVEAAKVKQELLNEALKNHITLTADDIAGINSLAEAYRAASEAAKEQAKSIQEMRQSAQEFESAEKSAFTGFFDDLAQGKSATEALRSALAGLGKKLMDLGLNMIANQMFKGTGDFLMQPNSGSVGSANINAGVVNVGGGGSLPGVGSVPGASAIPGVGGSSSSSASAGPLGGLLSFFGFGKKSAAPASSFSSSSSAVQSTPQVTEAAKSVAEKALPTFAKTPEFASAAKDVLPISERTFFQPKDQLPDFTSRGFKEAAFASGKDTTPLNVTKYPGLTHFGPEMKDPQNFIVHHTGGGNTQSTVDTLNQRGYGVQYTVDKEGRVFQLTPHPDNIASHIEPSSARNYPRLGAPKGVDNTNSIGVEVQAANDKAVTEAQKLSTAKLYESLHKQYPDLNNVYGHGIVNPGHKEADEGKTISEYINQQKEAQKALQAQVAQTTTSIKTLPPSLQSVQTGSLGLDSGLTEMTSTLAQGAPAANGFAGSIQSLVSSLAKPGAVGGGGFGLGSLFGFADGGHVKGPGSGTSDSIPAMLSDGEFVVNAKAASKHAPLLSMINAGKVPKFAAGGPVEMGFSNSPSSTTNIHVDARGADRGVESVVKAAVGKALDARKPAGDSFRRSDMQNLARLGLSSDKARMRNA